MLEIEVLWKSILLQKIPLQFVKICHCDWFNIELQGYKLGRTSRDRQDSESKKGKVVNKTQRKQDGQL